MFYKAGKNSLNRGSPLH